jgi:hypothetical protein
MSLPKTTRLFVTASILVGGSTARADGLDVTTYLSRVPGWHRAPLQALFLLCVLMALNYLLNLLVLGVPAIKMGAKAGSVALGLVTFTLLGQVADRIGAVVGPLVGGAIVWALHVGGRKSLGYGFSIGFFLNFILSGVVIGLLAQWYLRRRWALEGHRVAVLSVITGVLTNPLWGVWAIRALAGIVDPANRPPLS